VQADGGTRLVALAAAAVLAAGSASALAWPSSIARPTAGAPATTTATQGRAAVPVGLTVASLAVSSPLADLGLLPDGTLEVPADPALAGWYAAAARPGEPGPVVVVGHVDSRSGPGVFARLDDLVPGDRVELALADGGVAVYAVTASRQVAKDAFPTSEVYGAVTGDELRLITCGGDFDRRRGSYDDNVVVTAVRQ
jgi:hypothetical protein